MNVIIVGAGEVGRHLAENLSARPHNLCVIEILESLAADLNERLDSRVLCGNGASVTSLAEAGVGECELFLALTSDDNTNLVAASIAKSLGAAKTLARVHGGIQREEWLFDYKSHFHIDYLFSSERLAAIELAKFVRSPRGILVEEIARGRIELQQTRVSSNSAMLGKTLLELRLPPRVRIGLIQRQGTTLIPSAQDQLQQEDLVTVLGDPLKLADIVPALHGAEHPDDDINVVIFGGSETGFALAQMLEAGRARVRIVERDPKVCRALSESLQQTVVINGDATSLQLLREEQLEHADFFIACSRDDEDNVMACLQAKNLGTKYVLTLIHRADYADVISQNSRQLGIHAAVSPRVATGRDLMRFVTSEKYHVAMSLAGSAEVLEVVIAAKSRAANKKIADIPWPPGTGLVALLKGNQVIVPAGEDLIQPGDTIYGIVSAASRKPFVKLVCA